ncbi:hypothetical protein PPERSA_12318 [Pseudocohnilembus persalinus]|uniref:Uncharacterized protein n=1 Tax=Pseudocohnilembus persalinus TaxID=266149 RepID=A0A0V0R938_PSEPJ|nr:hypothetical protein PPERSA_12318 [Pseudocohnilembus persalinus]|eukprot:KRX10990.1 hypothetical protein PPERSA_12318 [Pseudocohnilembus persalinus]
MMDFKELEHITKENKTFDISQNYEKIQRNWEQFNGKNQSKSFFLQKSQKNEKNAKFDEEQDFNPFEDIYRTYKSLPVEKQVLNSLPQLEITQFKEKNGEKKLSNQEYIESLAKDLQNSQSKEEQKKDENKQIINISTKFKSEKIQRNQDFKEKKLRFGSDFIFNQKQVQGQDECEYEKQKEQKQEQEENYYNEDINNYQIKTPKSILKFRNIRDILQGEENVENENKNKKNNKVSSLEEEKQKVDLEIKNIKKIVKIVLFLVLNPFSLAFLVFLQNYCQNGYNLNEAYRQLQNGRQDKYDQNLEQENLDSEIDTVQELQQQKIDEDFVQEDTIEEMVNINVNLDDNDNDQGDFIDLNDIQNFQIKRKINVEIQENKVQNYQEEDEEILLNDNQQPDIQKQNQKRELIQENQDDELEQQNEQQDLNQEKNQKPQFFLFSDIEESFLKDHLNKRKRNSFEQVESTMIKERPLVDGSNFEEFYNLKNVASSVNQKAEIKKLYQYTNFNFRASENDFWHNVNNFFSTENEYPYEAVDEILNDDRLDFLQNCHEFKGRSGKFTVELPLFTEAFGFSFTYHIDFPPEKMIGNFSVYGLVENPIKRATFGSIDEIFLGEYEFFDENTMYRRNKKIVQTYYKCQEKAFELYEQQDF